MSAKQKVIQLVTGLREDLRAVNELEDLLIDQRKQLAAAEPDALDKVNGRVVSITARLEENGKNRTSILKGFGLEADRVGISALSKKLPENLSREVLEGFDKLEDLLNRCKQINDKNGELLASQKALTDAYLGRSGFTPYGETG